MAKPLLIDLYCGLGGWTRGFLAEGYECIGFDIERHRYTQAFAIADPETEDMRVHVEVKQYPAQLVLQDVLTLDGSQFKDAACIVASPPCQAYSYRAMPWKRAKALPPPSNELFNACSRMQREASEAAGRHIPLIIENVKGAQPWVGPARAHFGSYYLWGDVDSVGGRIVAGGLRFGDTLRAGKSQKFNPDGTDHGQGSWFKIANSKNRGVNGTKVSGLNWSGSDKPGYKAEAFNGTAEKRMRDGDSFGWDKKTPLRNNSSHSAARKAASAQIAEIPYDLARYVARAFSPRLAP